jgi:hypothetical protein
MVGKKEKRKGSGRGRKGIRVRKVWGRGGMQDRNRGREREMGTIEGKGGEIGKVKGRRGKMRKGKERGARPSNIYDMFTHLITPFWYAPCACYVPCDDVMQ